MKRFSSLVAFAAITLVFLLSACAPTGPQNLLIITSEVAYPTVGVTIRPVTFDEAVNHPEELYGEDGYQTLYYMVNDMIEVKSGESALLVARVDTYLDIDFTGFLVGDPPTYFKVKGQAGKIGRLMQDLCESTAKAENLGHKCY